MRLISLITGHSHQKGLLCREGISIFSLATLCETSNTLAVISIPLCAGGSASQSLPVTNCKPTGCHCVPLECLRKNFPGWLMNPNEGARKIKRKNSPFSYRCPVDKHGHIIPGCQECGIDKSRDKVIKWCLLIRLRNDVFTHIVMEAIA